MSNRPYVWQMIREAVEANNGKASYTEIKSYIAECYGSVNQSTINAQIIVCTVNQPSRIHYPENEKPRIANAQYDFLFTTGRGQVEFYNPEKHGFWEIRKDDVGRLVVGEVINAPEPQEIEHIAEASEFWFPLESHLRDFIAQNIEQLQVSGKRLRLYVDENGQTGVEYRTDIGRIDILAVDEDENFVVFELKLSRGADSAFGQLLRYMNWLKIHVAQDRDVLGVIVANRIDEKLKYSAFDHPKVTLFECELEFTLRPVSI